MVFAIVEAAGCRYGLSISVVSDMHTLHRIGQSSAWRMGDALTPVLLSGDSVTLIGREVPLVDLRRRLGLPPSLLTARKLAILAIQSGDCTFGLLIDRVLDIVETPAATVMPALPRADTSAPFGAVASICGEMVRILDADGLLPPVAAHA